MYRSPRRLFLLLAMLLSAGMAWAAGPDRPIRIVVPYPGGSMGDVLARLLAEDLRARLDQAVIVDNRPGAGGNLGTAAVAHAAADGHTLLLAAANNFVVNQYLYPRLGFDPLKDLAPVTVVATVPAVIFVNAALPASSFDELAAHARAHPGQLNFGSPGAGTPPHLAAQRINQSRGLGMTHVGYRGSPQALAALLANDVQLYLAGASLGLPHVRSGRLRALAVSSPERLALMPDTPTFAEIGLGDVQAQTWWGVAAPAGTPGPVLERLNAALVAGLQAPALRTRLSGMGVVALGGSREQMAGQLAREAGYWSHALAQMGIQAD